MKYFHFLILSFLLSSLSFASNYPTTYCDQRVGVDVYGPAAFGVISGCYGKNFLVGYKNSGYLASNPLRDSIGEYVEAIIISTCTSQFGEMIVTREQRVRLGREWHGNGFMTAEIQSRNFCEFNYNIQKVEIAFYSNAGWDSRYGENYIFNSFDVDTFENVSEPMNGQGLGIYPESFEYFVNFL